LRLDWDHPTCLNPVYQSDPTQGAADRVAGFEAEHGPDDPFAGPMVLLDTTFPGMMHWMESVGLTILADHRPEPSRDGAVCSKNYQIA